MDHSALICLATETADVACNLAVELPQRGLPESSFEHGLPSPFQSDSPDSGAFAARVKLLGLLDEFHNLLTEPVLLSSPELGTTVQVLAYQLNLNQNIVCRLLAHAATYHISFQSGPDFFNHTADSPVLTKNEAAGASKTPPTPHLPSSLHNPYSVTSFTKSMTYHTHLSGYSPNYLVNNFPWPLNESKTTIIGIGGGTDHIARALVSHSPNIKCIVQDRAEVIAQAEATLPPDLRERPVHGADVYLLRYALILALKAGAKVVINERRGVNERFEMVRVSRPERSYLAAIWIIWKG
ncbi:uncharacterized protein BDW43DRAFT_304581 [Aspergillus alliaceus]|uniref:uncharacterized protein n=1 Tax=Petromyces alliaceus TaxID=209559 RepID=UPI0012A453F2|nr:uncharacterized protein BDW43DRAFT_304581 [Aspergillus alliaceus]KAB8227478.1 hypothetical protein BDW43DRAFT_304581 [Aspergillus alliaceus]